MITKSTPPTWRRLQEDAARILSECGFTVEVEKKIQTARGEVELDIYAEETIKGRKYTIACECKHWKSKIPQTVIHSFRTVLSDLGINIGYIISLNGFQSGSFKASDFTNVELVTWGEFQTNFEEVWLEKYFSPQITERLDPILTYTEPLAPLWFKELTEEGKKVYSRLNSEYLPFGLVVMSFTPYSRHFTDEPFPSIPLNDLEKFKPELKARLPETILNEEGYREFLSLAFEYGDEGIRKFRELKTKYKA